MILKQDYIYNLRVKMGFNSINHIVLLTNLETLEVIILKLDDSIFSEKETGFAVGRYYNLSETLFEYEIGHKDDFPEYFV
jgi:hypothetical protein